MYISERDVTVIQFGQRFSINYRSKKNRRSVANIFSIFFLILYFLKEFKQKLSKTYKNFKSIANLETEKWLHNTVAMSHCKKRLNDWKWIWSWSKVLIAEISGIVPTDRYVAVLSIWRQVLSANKIVIQKVQETGQLISK